MCRPKPDVAIPVWEEKLGWNDPLRVGTRRPTQRKDHVQARRAVGALERERSGPPTPLSGVGWGDVHVAGINAPLCGTSVELLWGGCGRETTRGFNKGLKLEANLAPYLTNWKETLTIPSP